MRSPKPINVTLQNDAGIKLDFSEIARWMSLDESGISLRCYKLAPPIQKIPQG